RRSPALLTGHKSVARPSDRQLIDNSRQHLVATWIAPQDQVAGGDFCVAALRLITHLRLASELPAPFLNSVVLLGLHPCGDSGGRWRSGRAHKDKTREKRVIDRPLEPMPLMQAGLSVKVPQTPLSTRLQKVRCPGPVRHGL